MQMQDRSDMETGISTDWQSNSLCTASRLISVTACLLSSSPKWLPMAWHCQGTKYTRPGHWTRQIDRDDIDKYLLMSPNYSPIQLGKHRNIRNSGVYLCRASRTTGSAGLHSYGKWALVVKPVTFCTLRVYYWGHSYWQQASPRPVQIHSNESHLSPMRCHTYRTLALNGRW